jgi:magnesium chelatase accessory protein
MLPDRADWPFIHASRAIRAAGIDWHVQIIGSGPVVVLLHGTGGATHSWAPIVPMLASSFTLVIPDLPGHGFTGRPAASERLSVGGIADAMSALLRELRLSAIAGLVGHSAGGAVALELARGAARTDAVVGVNAALEVPPLARVPGLARVTRALAATPGVASAVTMFTNADRLLDSTGSRVPPRQRELYAYLFRSSDRVRAVLTMMAHWDLAQLSSAFSTLTTPTTLIAGSRDRWVPPRVAVAAAARLPRAHVAPVADVGHLAHEEAPECVAAIIRAALSMPDASRQAGRS